MTALTTIKTASPLTSPGSSYLTLCSNTADILPSATPLSVALSWFLGLEHLLKVERNKIKLSLQPLLSLANILACFLTQPRSRL